MNLTIEIRPVWKGILLVINVLTLLGIVLLFGGIVWKADSLILSCGIECFLIMIAVSMVFLLVAFSFIQIEAEITKKAIDWGLELTRKEAEETRRKEENKKADEEEEKRRNHELRLAEIANTVRVEVIGV